MWEERRQQTTQQAGRCSQASEWARPPRPEARFEWVDRCYSVCFFQYLLTLQLLDQLDGKEVQAAAGLAAATAAGRTDQREELNELLRAASHALRHGPHGNATPPSPAASLRKFDARKPPNHFLPPLRR